MVTGKSSNRTVISVHRDTVNRLKPYMKYGETFNVIINKLLDYYESTEGNVVSKIEGDKNETLKI